MRTETKFEKIVNVADDGEISVLEYTFMYGSDFKGAVGSRFYPISKQAYEDALKITNIIQHLKEAVSEADIPSEFQYSPSTGRDYKNPYKVWAKAIIEAGEAEQVMFDTSYSHMHEYLRSELSLTEKQAYIFDCTGGGRMFDKEYQGNFNIELSAIIRQYEN